MNNTQKEKIIADELMKNYDKYFRLAYSYAHNETDAMDIVQEGAYKAIYHSEALKKPEFAATWIYRIMINEALGFIRKNKTVNIAELQEDSAVTENKYENIDLKHAIEKLPAQERTIIVLRFFEELKIEQIAEILEENVNTIKSRLYRVLGKLKITLSE